MRIEIFKSVLLVVVCALFLTSAHAATRTASIKIDDKVLYQKITGFGGFVNSGQFAYNYMTTKEIRKLWGNGSEAGYNIMRMYLPIGEASWSQSLATAQLAKSLGIKVFASPWSMPAEWKTNNNIAAVYTDGNGVVQEGSLKEEYYDDYALYLNNYVTYLRNNGVELDAISIQNEPDMKATYAGCLWTPAQMAKFIKYYAPLIKCKIIAPESVGITDNYATALLEDSVCAAFDIFAGHQYSSIQSGLKNMQARGKDVWMTEYLINWNSDVNTTRNFNWTKDAFNFANKLNDALLANVNAWVHYASKRFYGLMGDGTYGTVNGALTKRGYIQSHYAKFATSTTRIEHVWTDDSKVLGGSSYISVTGDSIIVMIINSSSDTYSLTIDLPFYTKTGKIVTTTELLNLYSSSISFSEETCRPKIAISASSFTTLIFTKDSIRPASKMVGQAIHPNKIDNQLLTNTAFGTGYKLSGKTVVFDHSNSLISTNTSNSLGYLKLDVPFNQLVFHVNTVASTMNYTSANTTLYYINSNGSVGSYNYGTINFEVNGNYDWILDISRKVLPDGCIGVLGISNSNYSSILTINFGDVFFRFGSEKSYKFTGIYSNGDSYLLDCLEDSTYTSLDFTGTDSLTSEQDWNATAANKNCIYYTGSSVVNNHTNVITGTTCSNLSLLDGAVNVDVSNSFIATTASYSRTFDGLGMMVLPFVATIPEGVKVYTMQSSTTDVTCTQISNAIIPVNTPVLVQGSGTFKFEGSGVVSTPHALKVNNMVGVYISNVAPANSYTLKTVDGVTAFYRVNSGSEPTISPFRAYLSFNSINAATFIPLKFILTGVEPNRIESGMVDPNKPIFDLLGRQINQPKKGIYIQDGKKILF